MGVSPFFCEIIQDSRPQTAFFEGYMPLTRHMSEA